MGWKFFRDEKNIGVFEHFWGFQIYRARKSNYVHNGACLGPQIQKYHHSKICGLRQTQSVHISINLWLWLLNLFKSGKKIVYSGPLTVLQINILTLALVMCYDAQRGQFLVIIFYYYFVLITARFLALSRMRSQTDCLIDQRPFLLYKIRKLSFSHEM